MHCPFMRWHGRKNTRLGDRDRSWGLGVVMDWLIWSLGQVTSLFLDLNFLLTPSWRLNWMRWLPAPAFQVSWFHVILLKHWPTLPFLVRLRLKFFNCYSRPSSFWLYPSFSASPFRLTYSSNDAPVFLLPIQIQFPCKLAQSITSTLNPHFLKKISTPLMLMAIVVIFGLTHLL